MPKQGIPTDTEPKDIFAVIQPRVTAKNHVFKKVPLGVCEFVSFSDHLRSFGSPHHKQSSLEGSSSTSYLQNPVGLFSHSLGANWLGVFFTFGQDESRRPLFCHPKISPKLVHFKEASPNESCCCSGPVTVSPGPSRSCPGPLNASEEPNLLGGQPGHLLLYSAKHEPTRKPFQKSTTLL